MGRGAAVLLVAALVLTGCGDDAYVPAACARPTPLDDVPRIVARLPLTDDAIVTNVTLAKGYTSVDAFAHSSVVEIYPPLATKVLDGGFEILAAENEGFEAEIYFRKKRQLAGILRLREGPCAELVTIGLVYDPLETKAGRRAVRQAKQLKRRLERARAQGAPRSTQPSPTGG